MRRFKVWLAKLFYPFSPETRSLLRENRRISAKLKKTLDAWMAKPRDSG